MELAYYRIIFINNKEYLISSSKIKSVDQLLDDMNKNYITLQLKDGDPIFLDRSKLFSAQKINESVLSLNTQKIWKVIR